MRRCSSLLLLQSARQESSTGVIWLPLFEAEQPAGAAHGLVKTRIVDAALHRPSSAWVLYV